MSFGLEVYNDAGTLQFSPTMNNMILVASGNMTTVTNTFTGAPLLNSQCSVSYTRESSGHHPLIAIRPPNAATALYAINGTTTNNWTWTFVSAEATGVSIPYWIFDKKLRTAQSDFGLQIFDSAGNMTYHNNDKPIRIRDVRSGTFTYAQNQTVTYDTGKTYAAIMSKWTDNYLYLAINNKSNHRAQGVRGATDGMVFTNLPLVNGLDGDETPFARSAEQILVVDVTNY